MHNTDHHKHPYQVPKEFITGVVCYNPKGVPDVNIPLTRPREAREKGRCLPSPTVYHPIFWWSSRRYQSLYDRNEFAHSSVIGTKRTFIVDNFRNSVNTEDRISVTNAIAMVSRGDLGLGYLFGSSLGLFVSVTGYYVMVHDQVFITLLGTGTAIVLSGSLAYIGAWLYLNEFETESIWKVAQWSAIGLSVPTFFGILLTIVKLDSPMDSLVGILLINLTVIGGLAGILTGTVLELRRQHSSVRELNRRNLVLNRILRHNIRNDMNVLYGYVDRLVSASGEMQDAIAERAKDKISKVVDISQKARTVEKIEGMAEPVPIDLVAVTDDRIQAAAASVPAAEISLDAPDAVWVEADPLIDAILDNLLENAIEHNDQEPRVEVTIRAEDETVAIEIADNGPGIPTDQRDIVRGADETKLNHGNGLGLWLVKWYVDSHEGALDIADNEPRGTVVTLTLPRADTDRIDEIPGDGHPEAWNPERSNPEPFGPIEK